MCLQHKEQVHIWRKVWGYGASTIVENKIHHLILVIPDLLFKVAIPCNSHFGKKLFC